MPDTDPRPRSDHPPSPTATKRALAALAADPGSASTTDPIDRAADAIDDVERAAAFRRADGRPRLERAIERAADRGDRERVRQGQRALAAFEWVRRAALLTEFL